VPAEIQIRLLGADDAASYRRCRLEQLEAEPDAFGESVDEASRVPLDVIASRLGAPADESAVFAAFDGDSIVGTAGWYRFREVKTRHKGRIGGVYVRAPYRGRGIGRRMIRAVIGAAAGAGVEQLMLSVVSKQTAAVHLYESLGFKSIGREERALKIGERYVDEELMTLRLPTTAA